MVSHEIARVLRKRAAALELHKAANDLSVDAWQSLLRDFAMEKYAPGQAIIREGEKADYFYLVYKGDVLVSRKTDTEDEVLATLHPGNYFGEAGLIYGAPRNATVTAGQGEVTAFRCDSAAFRKLVHEAGGKNGDLALALSRRLKTG